MDRCVLLILASVVISSSAWSVPYYPARHAPVRVVRYAVPPHRHYAPPDPHHHRIPVRPVHEPEVQANSEQDQPQWQRPKRGHEYDHDHDHRGSSGVTGPVHTFVKTDKNANYKWGVRHHVGDKFSS